PSSVELRDLLADRRVRVVGEIEGDEVGHERQADRVRLQVPRRVQVGLVRLDVGQCVHGGVVELSADVATDGPRLDHVDLLWIPPKSFDATLDLVRRDLGLKRHSDDVVDHANLLRFSRDGLTYGRSTTWA